MAKVPIITTSVIWRLVKGSVNKAWFKYRKPPLMKRLTKRPITAPVITKEIERID
jgi:hypothetical protein